MDFAVGRMNKRYLMKVFTLMCKIQTQSPWTVGRQSTDSRPTVGRLQIQSADSRPTAQTQSPWTVGRQSVRQSADSRPTASVGRQSADCRPTVHGLCVEQSADFAFISESTIRLFACSYPQDCKDCCYTEIHKIVKIVAILRSQHCKDCCYTKITRV